MEGVVGVCGGGGTAAIDEGEEERMADWLVVGTGVMRGVGGPELAGDGG